MTWTTLILYAIGSYVVVIGLGGDWEWKRRLFETHAEKMKRPKYREKYLKHALRNTPWLLPGHKPWHEMEEERRKNPQ